jgi:c-di-GMP-binding flagellar brake protein YcgR
MDAETELKDILARIERVRCEQQENCTHRFICDLIDIDPDRSVMIVYCELCEKMNG